MSLKKNGNGIKITNKEFFTKIHSDVEEIKEILHTIKEDNIKTKGKIIAIQSKQRLHEKMILGCYAFCVVVLGFLFQKIIVGG